VRRPVDPRISTPWFFSPNKGQVTFLSLSFTTSSGSQTNSSFSNCTVTYDRTLSSGAALLDCPISVPAGTYTQVSLCFAANEQILISDPTVPLYTDPNAPTLLSSSPPSGGAGYVTYTTGNGTNPCFGVPLPTPFTVSSATPPTISIITDMTHTVPGTLTGSTYAFTMNSANRPVEVVPAPGTGGHSEFYSDQSTFVLNGPTGENFERIYYDGNGNPVAAGGLSLCDTGIVAAYAYPFSASSAPADAGIYLGIDSSQNLAWAIPDISPSTSGSVFVLPRGTTLGSPTTIKCKNSVAPIPVPSSGSTYASGAPTISSPDQSMPFYLWAK
jgi:hypothetical protein